MTCRYTAVGNYECSNIQNLEHFGDVNRASCSNHAQCNSKFCAYGPKGNFCSPAQSCSKNNPCPFGTGQQCINGECSLNGIIKYRNGGNNGDAIVSTTPPPPTYQGPLSGWFNPPPQFPPSQNPFEFRMPF